MSHTNGTRNANKEENEEWVIELERRCRSYDPSQYGGKMEMRSIYRWPNDLAEASAGSSYHRTPWLTSFGPYHHGKEHLQHMEHHKVRALCRILDRSKVPLSSFIDSLKVIKQELMDNYDNLDPELSSDLFLQVMLLDGCFLLELLRFSKESQNNGIYEPLFSDNGWQTIAITKWDMLKLENQIPLVVLTKLLEVEKGESIEKKCLHDLVAKLYFPQGFDPPVNDKSLHILDIYMNCLIVERTQKEQTPASIRWRCQPWLYLAAKGLNYLLIAIPIWVLRILHGRIPKDGHTRRAIKLHAAGIWFKKGEPNCGLKITFDEKNGILTLPHITVDDSTPVIFTNLMAFERMHQIKKKKVTEYVVIMDDLIDTAEDVSLLCSLGIVSNFLGSDEDAAKLFNTLSGGQILPTTDCEVITVREKLQRYVSSDWNMALAYLKHKYFHNPWSVISLLAATVLLILTFIQTVFSGVALTKGH